MKNLTAFFNLFLVPFIFISNQVTLQKINFQFLNSIKRWLAGLAMLALLFIFPVQIHAVDIWTEDFSGQNDKGATGSTIDVAGVTWTIDVSGTTLNNNNDWFHVENEAFDGRDLDGVAIWESPTIDISAYQNVNFALDTSKSGGTMENDDYVGVYYSINGGGFIESNTLNDDFAAQTITQSIGTGTSLKIRVIMRNNGGQERYNFDNILVTGDVAGTASYSCPGEDVEFINGATGDAYKEYNTGEDIAEVARYFKFQTAVDGEITIHQQNNKPVGGYWNHELRVGTSCDGTQIYDGPNTSDDSTTFNVTAGTTYYVRVEERNNQNVLNFDISFDFTATAPNICSAFNGLSADYYNNDSFTSPIGLSRVDDTINFEWGSGGPGGGINSDYFSTVWTGTIYFPEDADYIFSLAHDDTMELIIDGTTIYNGTSWTGGSNNFVDAASTYFAAGTYPITIRFVEWTGGAYAKLAWRNNGSIGSRTIIQSQYLCSVPSTPAPPTMGDIPDQPASVGSSFTLSVASYVTEPNGDTITYSATGLPPGLTIDSSTGEITGTPTAAGTYSVTATATDVDGSASDGFNIVVTVPLPVATNDNYTITPGASITGNFITDDTGNGVDTGVNIVATTSPVSGPTQGSVVISSDGTFTYTPDSTAVISDSFTYTITDDYGQTSTATVTITIEVQETSGSELPFYLINPDNTRNIIGNYAIAGNTVLCLINQTNGYGDASDTCQGDTNYQDITSNMRVVKYLDIDGDNSTWNSTSSNVTLPNTFDPEGGVLWAGLFWGGRISADNGYNIRYAVESGPTYTTVETGQGDNPDVDVDDIDLIAFGANDIKLKVNSGVYNDASAATFHVYESSGGKTYAAYADVTSLLSDINTSGTHTFTVANLTTMEGREGSPGAFGGWSLVVIYAEDFNLGKARNISIYNGFVSIDENNNPISISGFKLPKTGDVDAQLAIFSGEGEHLYGRTSNSNNEDWLKISDNINSGYDYMPGLTVGTHLGNRDNSFNAQLVGIERDHVLDTNGNNMFNDLGINNVGVDIDTFDVSALMETYRNSNQDINEVFIQTFSDNDYITSSMIAYSAELYVPELCYDYTLDIDGYVLTSEDNHISTPFGGFGYPLRTQIFLKSLEGDIDLKDFNVTYNIVDTSQLTYQDCSTEISEEGAYDYEDACPFTVDPTAAGFTMYIGSGKTSTTGGTISANESRYLSWQSDFQTSLVNTDFTFAADYTVNYGSGAVPLHKQFTSADLCPPDLTIPGGYLPEFGTFNIVDGNAADHTQYNLYTQVANRPFDLTIYAYDATNLTDLITTDLNLSVEVEMIRADNFIRDAQTACDDQYSILDDVPAKFAYFDEDTNANVQYDTNDVNLAYRSAALRVWYLTDVNGTGTLVNDHNCTRPNQAGCIDLYEDKYTTDTQCNAICNDAAAWDPVINNCYNCLRTNYGRKVCSRDNFAIRPESFVTQIFDSNQSTNIDDPTIQIAHSVSDTDDFSVVAGYFYRFDVNATNHADSTATPRYIQNFAPGSASTWVRMVWFPDGHTVSGCNDAEDKNISINIFNGSTVNNFTRQSFLDQVDQIGKYRFEVHDSNWTSADWDPDKMLHHTGPYANNYTAAATDCITGSSTVLSSTTAGRQGCEISSVHTNEDTGVVYTPLDAQYYPYTFNTNALSIFAGPQGTGNVVYINSPGADDQNMSYNVQGTFFASGFNDENVTNFVTNCYAEDVNMSLYQRFLHATPDSTNEPSALPTPFLTYDLVDFNITDPSDIIRPRHQNTFAFANDDTTAQPLPPLVIIQQAQWFRQDMGGAITMDLGYNFNRRFDTVLNPRRIQMNDFNITYTVSPADIHVDMKTNYQIFGNRDLNDQNVSFFYGRAKPGKFFYEDITDNFVDTPISILAYCDLGFVECQERGIQSPFAGTNEANWWLSVDHRTINEDGDIQLTVGSIPEGAGSPTVTSSNPPLVTINDDTATDYSVQVLRGANPTLPMTVGIDFVSPPTDVWIIYNEDNNSIPSPFYRVRFIGQSDWAGHGDTGFVVDDNASIQKNRRLGW